MAKIRQTKYIVMITKEGSTKIVNFMTPRAGVLVLGHGHLRLSLESVGINMFKLMCYGVEIWLIFSLHSLLKSCEVS